MNWARLTGRNHLKVDFGPEDNYAAPVIPPEGEGTMVPRSVMAGELHRMMWDQLLDASQYAAVAGCTAEQARKVLRAVFNQPEPGCPACQSQDLMSNSQYDHRCNVHRVGGSHVRYENGPVAVDDLRKQGLI